jgi:hypothetical protein
MRMSGDGKSNGVPFSYPQGELISAQEFRDNGLLWAINRYCFHPQGLALGLQQSDQDPHGYDGFTIGAAPEGEVFTFEPEQDDTLYRRYEDFKVLVKDAAREHQRVLAEAGEGTDDD